MSNNGREGGAPGDPRLRILGSALEVFAARGFRAGSLNDIAKAAGLTRAGLLHHYPSKQAVLLALLEQRDAELRRTTRTSGLTLLELLKELEHLTGLILANRDLVQLAHILTAEASGEAHPAREWVARRYVALRAELADAVRLSVETGELPPELNPDDFAALLLGAIEGAENQWLVSPEEVDPAAVLRQLRALCSAVRSG
ncbi:TetR/AcrR family transcriptional regulator [Streptomyces sp. NPDC050619]|uniref:TetR/AcrR family transcriptional regulator n=1 Tax=Streptomyces sp. NPDC050619 TaxID=3157214 RepID=UPI00341F6931